MSRFFGDARTFIKVLKKTSHSSMLDLIDFAQLLNQLIHPHSGL